MPAIGLRRIRSGTTKPSFEQPGAITPPEQQTPAQSLPSNLRTPGRAATTIFGGPVGGALASDIPGLGATKEAFRQEATTDFGAVSERKLGTFDKVVELLDWGGQFNRGVIHGISTVDPDAPFNENIKHIFSEGRRAQAGTIESTAGAKLLLESTGKSPEQLNFAERLGIRVGGFTVDVATDPLMLVGVPLKVGTKWLSNVSKFAFRKTPGVAKVAAAFNDSTQGYWLQRMARYRHEVPEEMVSLVEMNSRNADVVGLETGRLGKQIARGPAEVQRTLTTERRGEAKITRLANEIPPEVAVAFDRGANWIDKLSKTLYQGGVISYETYRAGAKKYLPQLNEVLHVNQSPGKVRKNWQKMTSSWFGKYDHETLRREGLGAVLRDDLIDEWRAAVMGFANTKKKGSGLVLQNAPELYRAKSPKDLVRVVKEIYPTFAKENADILANATTDLANLINTGPGKSAWHIFDIPKPGTGTTKAPARLKARKKDFIRGTAIDRYKNVVATHLKNDKFTREFNPKAVRSERQLRKEAEKALKGKGLTKAQINGALDSADDSLRQLEAEGTELFGLSKEREQALGPLDFRADLLVETTIKQQSAIISNNRFYNHVASRWALDNLEQVKQVTGIATEGVLKERKVFKGGLVSKPLTKEVRKFTTAEEFVEALSTPRKAAKGDWKLNRSEYLAKYPDTINKQPWEMSWIEQEKVFVQGRLAKSEEMAAARKAFNAETEVGSTARKKAGRLVEQIDRKADIEIKELVIDAKTSPKALAKLNNYRDGIKGRTKAQLTDIFNQAAEGKALKEKPENIKRAAMMRLKNLKGKDIASFPARFESWKQVPDDKIYDKLAGKYVPRGVHDEVVAGQRLLRHYNHPGAISAATSIWKAFKILAFDVAGRNLQSGYVALTQVRPQAGIRWPAAMKTWAKHLVWESGRGAEPTSDAWKVFRKYGIPGSSFTGAELQPAGKVASTIRGKVGREAEKAGRYSLNALRVMYRAGDEPAKLAIIDDVLQARKYSSIKNAAERKAIEIEAVKAAEKALFNYKFNPPIIEKLRRGLVPFVVYPYKATGLFFDTLIKHPNRLMAYERFKANFAALGPAVDKDNVRDFLQEQTPVYEDNKGDVVFWGSDYSDPQGFLKRPDPGLLFGGRSMLPGGLGLNPLLSELIEQAANKETFFDRPITDKALVRDQFKDRATHAFKTFAPGLADTIKKPAQAALSQREGISDRKFNIKEALISELTGAKFSPIDIDRERDLVFSEEQRELNRIDREIDAVLSNPTTSEASKDKKVGRLLRKRDRILGD